MDNPYTGWHPIPKPDPGWKDRVIREATLKEIKRIVREVLREENASEESCAQHQPS